MKKIKYRKSRKIQPLQPEYNGNFKEVKTEIQLFVYDENEIEEYVDLQANDVQPLIKLGKMHWLNVHGLNDSAVLSSLLLSLNIDAYVLNDILNTGRRTRIEELEDVVFFGIKSILPHENQNSLNIEHLSFVLQENILISFQEKRGDFFTHIRERMRTNTGMVRKRKTDFLLYLLLDAVMENFYLTIENKEINIEKIILDSKNDAQPVVLEQIEQESEDFNYLKRAIIPLREALYTLKTAQEEDPYIENQNLIYFSRLHQKSLELLDQIDYDNNALESASNFYFSTQSHKMNEIMKTLTIVASIFIPLTFIAGIYGMNFENMPELSEPNGYFWALGVMFLLVVLMMVYFKKKKWF